MFEKIYIGIDNGVTGSIAVVGRGVRPVLLPTPTKIEIDYQKSSTRKRTRVDYGKLCQILADIKIKTDSAGYDLFAICERPMINPERFDATISASRAQESTLIALEHFQIPYEYIDSKNWQKAMLPEGASGDALKLASRTIGKRFFPQLGEEIERQKDADSLLMALWAYKNNR